MAGDLISPIVFSPEFLGCMPFIYKEEGGDTNDKHDSGSETRKGIIQREYDAFRKSKGEPLQTVFAASDAEIQEIYWFQYWLPNCPQVRIGGDLCLFNFQINAGVTEAVKILQRAVNVPDDGHFGLITKAACDAAEPHKLIYAFTLKEEAFYRSLKTFKYFGKDWIGRCERCEALALQMLQKSVTPPVQNMPPVAPATSADAQKAVAEKTGAYHV